MIIKHRTSNHATTSLNIVGKENGKLLDSGNTRSRDFPDEIKLCYAYDPMLKIPLLARMGQWRTSMWGSSY